MFIVNVGFHTMCVKAISDIFGGSFIIMYILLAVILNCDQLSAIFVFVLLSESPYLATYRE